MNKPRLRCAIVGYGPAFNWGWMHTWWMKAVPEMEDGRRVITVLETAEKSSKSGRSEDVPYR